MQAVTAQSESPVSVPEQLHGAFAPPQMALDTLDLDTMDPACVMNSRSRSHTQLLMVSIRSPSVHPRHEVLLVLRTKKAECHILQEFGGVVNSFRKIVVTVLVL